MRIPFEADHTLALPTSFKTIDTSKVRWILSMDDAATALQRYEGVTRQEMMVSAELDQIFDVHDSEFKSMKWTACLSNELSRTI